MASNFKIYVQRNSDDLHIKLEGDFDGTSACQLLNVMKENQHGVSKIFIDTSLLDYIYSFGRDVFHNNLNAVNIQRISLLFTGDSSLQQTQKENRVVEAESFSLRPLSCTLLPEGKQEHSPCQLV